MSNGTWTLDLERILYSTCIKENEPVKKVSKTASVQWVFTQDQMFSRSFYSKFNSNSCWFDSTLINLQISFLLLSWILPWLLLFVCSPQPTQKVFSRIHRLVKDLLGFWDLVASVHIQILNLKFPLPFFFNNQRIESRYCSFPLDLYHTFH